MSRLSLRWMMLVPILATIAVGFVAFALYVDHAERTTRLAEIDRELDRAERAGAPSPPTESPGSPAGAAGAAGAAVGEATPPVQLVVSASGRITARLGAPNPFSPATLRALAGTEERTTTQVGDYRVRVSPQPAQEVLVTALSLDSHRAAVADLRRGLVVGGLVILLLEAVVVWLLAGALVRPLSTMSHRAARIADGDLEIGIARAGGSREVADLSADIARMLTRLRTALAEQERSAAEATGARDDMRRFLADVSHEIRTPLTALKGYSDLYEQGMLDEPGALTRAMSRVGSESVRLHALVNSMLELARHGEGPPPVVVDVDVPAVAASVVDDLRVAFPGRRIELVAGEPARTPATVPGDPARIHQAVLNLGANACTHTPAGTPVAVVVGVEGPMLSIAVVDHGEGVEEAEQEQLFLPFYQSDPSRTRGPHRGFGLGLALTRQIAHDHHGSVAVQPTPGGGATFVLRLPTSGVATPDRATGS